MIQTKKKKKNTLYKFEIQEKGGVSKISFDKMETYQSTRRPSSLGYISFHHKIKNKKRFFKQFYLLSI